MWKESTRWKVVEKLGNCFGLHPLVLEDILNTDQRPKMEGLVHCRHHWHLDVDLF